MGENQVVFEIELDTANLSVWIGQKDGYFVGPKQSTDPRRSMARLNRQLHGRALKP